MLFSRINHLNQKALRQSFGVASFFKGGVENSIRGFTKSSASKKIATTSRAKLMNIEIPFNVGRAFLAGSSLFGLGALCYYGLGVSNEISAIDQYNFWPEFVRQRIANTYMYFGGGLGISAASAYAVYRSPTLWNMMTKNSPMALIGALAALIGSSMLCQSIPYSPGIGSKQLSWALFCGVMGAVVAPVSALGGSIVLRALTYTLGISSGLSAIAMCAPSEKFLNMGGPLAICFGLVFAASIAGMFFPPTKMLGASLYSISVYGGLVLFSLFLLYDTQHIIKKAKQYPIYNNRSYDPVNASLGIYTDVMNIFIRMAMILGNGNKRN